MSPPDRVFLSRSVIEAFSLQCFPAAFFASEALCASLTFSGMERREIRRREAPLRESGYLTVVDGHGVVGTDPEPYESSRQHGLGRARQLC